MDNSNIGVNVPTVNVIDNLFNYISHFSVDSIAIIHIAKTFIGVFIAISIPLSLLLFFGIIIFASKLRMIRRLEEEIYNPKIETGYMDGKDEIKSNPDFAKRWDSALKHVESQNENDWRQSVIEADILLGDLLTSLGYKGEGIGEQLKRATKADFKTLDEAWEAHKIRNELAHSGSDYSFSQYEARRVIQLYRKVFEEFFYI